jgi:hypothetical protein
LVFYASAGFMFDAILDGQKLAIREEIIPN